MSRLIGEIKKVEVVEHERKGNFFLRIVVENMTCDVSTIFWSFGGGMVSASIDNMTPEDIIQLRDMLTEEIEKLQEAAKC